MKISTLIANRFGRGASNFVFAVLVLACCVPFLMASDAADIPAPASHALKSPCTDSECILGFARAQRWNESALTANAAHHFPNLLVEITCFGWCASGKENQAWLGEHVDTSIFGARVMDSLSAVNPHLDGYVYALLWYTLDDSTRDDYNIEDKWQRDLTRWAAARGLDEEEFYLHTSIPTLQCLSPAKTRPCRLNTRWGGYGTNWYGNVGDPHFVQYTRDRAQRMVAGKNAHESIFWDTMDSGGLHQHGCGPKTPSLEYGDSCELYEKQIVQLVIQVRDALGGRPLQVNTASYTSAVSPYNGWIAVAAGSVHTEGLNTPFREYSDAWKYIDDLLNAGVKVAFTSNWYTREEELVRLGAWAHWKTDYSGGNYGSGLRRYQMTTLAQHYLLTPKRLSSNFYWNPNPQDWEMAYGKQWLPALEVDLGQPIDSRRVLSSSGFDGAGQSYDLYRREFSNAYVFVRPMKSWSNTAWDDRTAIQVQLPDENLSLLTAEGSSVPVHGTSIWLRNGEGVILLRSKEDAGKAGKASPVAALIP